ncbi:MAG TPA: RNA polymerase sigma factor RpoE [Xylella fastidiosa subsp. multiplex]
MAETKQPQSLDIELVRRVQCGEYAAFDTLVRKYQHRVIALIGRYIADWSECQDVAQETFVRAYRGICNFRGDAQFSTWLHRIAVNTAKNHLAARNRSLLSNEAEIEEAEQFNHSSHLSDTNTPERELMRQELEQIVMSTVQALPEEFRTAFTLCEIEGLSYQEIAQRMDCPIGTVRSRIFRAREAIDIELRPFLEINNITRKRYRV